MQAPGLINQHSGRLDHMTCKDTSCKRHPRCQSRFILQLHAADRMSPS
jgi:hypothetical protein